MLEIGSGQPPDWKESGVLAHDEQVPVTPPELLEAVADLINANQRLRANLDTNAMVLKQGAYAAPGGTRSW